MSAPLLKYCGNQTLEDYQLTANSKAHFIGFVFYKKSKRCVRPTDVAEWVRQVGKMEYQRHVGVFVNPSIDELNQVLDAVNLDIIQLHGTESPLFVNQARKMLGHKIWKAIHHDAGSLTKMRFYHGLVDGYVIDSKVKNLWGGTGRSFDWAHISDYQEEAERQGVPCFIAGGISPANVNHLLTYQPLGIDMASGIEEDGKKSERLIRDLERKVAEIS